MNFWRGLEEAVKVVVLYQMGELSMKCTTCCAEQQESLNCCSMYSDDIESYYDSLSETQYYQCPISLVPNSLMDILDQYDFEKEFYTPRSTKDTLYLYWFIISKLKEYQADFNEKRSKRAEHRNRR